MDIKRLVDNACLVWEENGFYKSGNTKLFDGRVKETAATILRALDGYGILYAYNILEACKMALKQAPIHLEKEKPP